MTDSNFKCLAVEDVDENRSLLARPFRRLALWTARMWPKAIAET